jgi:hypothetical protein
MFPARLKPRWKLLLFGGYRPCGLVNVKIGDQLKKGQILFQIDSQEGRNQLTQSEASLDITQVNYETALQA